MTVDAFGGYTSRAARFLTIALVAAVLAGCSLFGPVKVKEDPIIPATTLYQKALDDIDRQYFTSAIKSLEQLDRQHPRDLFDVKLLYENEGLTDDLFRAFLVYAACSSRPVHELLAPNEKDIDDDFAREFAGMTVDPINIDALLSARKRMIDDIQARLNGNAADFLRTLQAGEPDFTLIGLPQAADLPAIKWKVLNLQKLIADNPDKHRAQSDALKAILLDRTQD